MFSAWDVEPWVEFFDQLLKVLFFYCVTAKVISINHLRFLSYGVQLARLRVTSAAASPVSPPSQPGCTRLCVFTSSGETC